MRRKCVSFIFAVTLAVSLFAAGCGKGGGHNSIGKFESTNNGIFLHKDLSVEDAQYNEFDPKKYDDKEYKGFLQEDLDKYNAANTFVAPTIYNSKEEYSYEYKTPIAIVKCEEKDGELCQMLRYATAKDYVNYNKDVIKAKGGTTLQAGTLATADSSILSSLFVDEKGEAVDVNKLATGSNAGAYRYLVCNFTAVLYGDGDIVGYTTSGKFDNDTYSVSVPENQTVTVIYK